MRWSIVFEILFTLSINNFALTAPELVQEKHHAYVDTVHVPKDVVNVLEKRGDEFPKLVKYFDFFKAADAHAPSSSSSAPPDPLSLSLGLSSTGSSMKGGTDNSNKLDKEYFDFFKAADAHAPSSSSSAPPDPLGLSLGPSSTGSSMTGVTDNLNMGQKSVNSPKPPSLPPPAPMRDAGLQGKWWYDGQDGPMYTPVSLSGPDRELTGVHALQPPPSKRPRLGLGSKLDVPAPAPNLASPTVNPAPLVNPLSLSLGPSSTGSSMKGVTDNLNTGQKSVKSPKPPGLPPPAPLRDARLKGKGRYDGPDEPMYTPMSLSGPDRELTRIHALQPPPSERPRLGLGSKLAMPAPAPNLASPTVNPAPLAELPSVASTASRKKPWGYYSDRLAALRGGTKPPEWDSWNRQPRPALWRKPKPKSPELPTVPEQEAGTGPLPNPSSPID